ncbi:MAG: hypothetical protein HFF58_06740 [Lawsonibacter sp.]|jgi:hypothetical protein|nr:hypothetical protein [Lawsonibacter sp.]
MPKRYEFHSRLSPEEIYIRLRAYAKPQKWDSCNEKTFYYKRLKKGFLLTYTGEWYGKRALPLWVQITEEKGGSLISGGFPVWGWAWQTAALFFGFTVLMTPIFGIPLRMYPMIITMLLLYVPICAGFWGWTGAAFDRKKRRAILEFIQTYLLE